MPPAAASSDPGHVVEDQSAVFAVFGDPATHGSAAPVVRIDTHGAAVFLAGSEAYKVKRAVRFPFMDFSTLEKRRRACEDEVAINAPGAPGIYLGVIPVTRDDDGRLRLGGSGRPVEYCVHMRRFDETRTLDRVAESEGLPDTLLDRLVDAVLASHARAPRRDGEAATDALARYVDQNEAAFAEMPDVFPADRATALDRRMRQEWERLRPLLVARGTEGFVRRCHGDLHLRNIALIEDRPTLFDAIEFDDGIASGDVLYDLAFLIMDLWERGFCTGANRVLGRYLGASPDAMFPGLEALPLFISLRATIRAKVIAAALDRIPAQIRARSRADVGRYFELAEAALRPAPARLVAVGGLSGTGKTTVAARLAPDVGRIPGAVVLRSDTIRKRLAGVAETERLPPGSYTPESAAAVYEHLRRRARLALAAGASVVVDAVHLRAEERAAIEDVAAEAGAPFTGLWLEAAPGLLERRVETRTADASDATGPVVRFQAAQDPGPIGWTRIDAGRDVDVVVAEARGIARGL